MRKLLSALSFFLFGFAPVLAADIPLKAPPLFSPVPARNWTGLYAGVHLGGIGGHFINNVPLISGPTDNGGSVMGGAQAGYNWQVNQLVFGIEADISGMSVKATSLTRSFEEEWMSTVRGRLGYAWDRYLAYVTGGVGFTHVNVGIAGTGSASSTRAGAAVGAGIEAVLWSPQWTGRVEYLYVNVPMHTYLINGSQVDGGSHNHVGRAALNYRFW